MDLNGRRVGLLHALPLLLLLAGVALPLARGTETLFLRDVFNAHLPMKVAQAEALRAGFFPLLDPWRAGGQPLAGNPNAVPFYPTNLLYLTGSPVWALNAHFWLHLLLAPLAFFWLARAWGLGRGAAWVSATLWAVSGFFLSHLTFYNLIGGVTLAPALAAAALEMVRRPERRWPAAAFALLWGLLLVAGDPLIAALALAIALGALAVAPRGNIPSLDVGEGLAPSRAGASPAPTKAGRIPFLRLLAALAAGALLAAPQLIEFLRILPLSFRGHWGFTTQAATIASFDPRQAVEWLLPFVFGRPDLLTQGSFWGSRFYTGFPPYYFALYPGLLALALVAAIVQRPRFGRTAGGSTSLPGRAALWAWGAVAFGLFFSLGRFNPAAAWLLGLAGGGALRYPVKFWLPVALGAALLGGLGFEALARGEDGARRRFRLALVALAGFHLIAGVFLLRADLSLPVLRGLIPESFGDGFVAGERLRLAALCTVSLLLVGALAVAAWLLRRRPVFGGVLLIALHAGSQLWLLQPLRPIDAVVPYRVPPPALAEVPAEARVVHGSYLGLFGTSGLAAGNFPAPHIRWIERRSFYELYPATGAWWHRRYELNVSPEGLDSFLTRAAQGAIKGAPDGARLRLLAAWGVDRLLLDRPLDCPSENGGCRPLAIIPSFGKTLSVYAVPGTAPGLHLAHRIYQAPHLQAAVFRMLDPGFDPARDVVLAGDGPDRTAAGGRILTLKEGPESLTAEVDTPTPTVLVVQRAHLPLYQAAVDGRPAAIEIANLHRLAIPVPAGRHRVRLWIDRRSLPWGFAGSVLGLLAVFLLGWRRGLFRQSRSE